MDKGWFIRIRRNRPRTRNPTTVHTKIQFACHNPILDRAILRVGADMMAFQSVKTKIQEPADLPIY